MSTSLYRWNVIFCLMFEQNLYDEIVSGVGREQIDEE